MSDNEVADDDDQTPHAPATEDGGGHDNDSASIAKTTRDETENPAVAAGDQVEDTRNGGNNARNESTGSLTNPNDKETSLGDTAKLLVEKKITMELRCQADSGQSVLQAMQEQNSDEMDLEKVIEQNSKQEAKTVVYTMIMATKSRST